MDQPQLTCAVTRSTGDERRLRILMTTQPGVGHVGPLAPLGRALLAAGHDVRVATARAFGPTVAAMGLPSASAGMDWLLAAEDAAFPTLAKLRETAPETIDDWAAREMFRGELAERMLPDLLRLSDAWRPDLVVREPLEFGGHVAAELLGVPQVVAGAIWFRDPVWEAGVSGRLEALRRRHGLPADPEASGVYGELALPMMPPAWVAPDEPLPPRRQFIRPEPIHPDSAAPGDLADWACRQTRRPTALVSLGTVFNRPAEFAPILAALETLEIEALVTIGTNLDPAGFGVLPEHVRLTQYAPHEALLPRCDLFVTHGGFSSLMAAFRAGTPVVALPIGGDQPRNARRCVELGVGLAVEAKQRSPEMIAAVIRAVASGAAYRVAAQALRTQIASMPGPRDAADFVIALARNSASRPDAGKVLGLGEECRARRKNP